MLPRHSMSSLLTRRQQGFLSPRTWGVLVVLLALLLIPFWWSKKINNKTEAEIALNNGTATPAQKAAAAAANGPALAAEQAAVGNSTIVDSNGVERTKPGILAAAQPSAASDPNRHGLSFGHLPDTDGLAVSACSGAPLDMARPDKNQCNPYTGDTACRTALPILCVSTTSDTGTTLGTTAPVAGFILGSLAQANARCSAELGTGWRMADFHDSGGWNITGKRGISMYNANLRHWVNISDQKANCWDPA